MLRLYLAPIFIMAAGTKYISSSTVLGFIKVPEVHYGIFPIVKPNIVEWFGNSEWGLGLPYPEVMASLEVYAEFFGAIFLIIGFAVRWISIPLMVTMIVAAITTHMQNGWLAIATGSGIFATDRTVGAIERLDVAKDILKEHGNYSWLTENGSIVILNNGIEFAATYFILLLALFFMGAGRYFSIDYWIAKNYQRI